MVTGMAAEGSSGGLGGAQRPGPQLAWVDEAAGLLFYIHLSRQHARILQPEKTIESSRKSGLAWKVGLLQVLLDKFGLEGYPAWVLPLAKFPSLDLSRKYASVVAR